MSAASLCCKACGGQLGPVFYAVDDVPVHSCLLLSSRAEAQDFPRGNVRLAPCLQCGTITNIAFDPRWSAYSPEYEDQQAFSPTFNSFAHRLAKDLVERHQLTGETVVDIGCSKGDFLALMCDAGVKQGIGIDPSVVPGRVPQPEQGTISLIDAYYSEDHTSIHAKLISNRHTLEHVHDVHDMLCRMHRHAVKADAAITFIEVPSMTRVLDEGAFEDIYYEHCSYFTPGALARALRKAGFGIKRIWLEYDDQYLLAEATLDPTHNQFFDVEEPAVGVLSKLTNFKRNTTEKQAAWRKALEIAQANGHNVAIWGSGSKCVAFWHAMHEPKCISKIIDINPNRWGRYPPGVPLAISKPEDLLESHPNVVIVMNGIYINEVKSDLSALGISAKIIPLGADYTSVEKEFNLSKFDYQSRGVTKVGNNI